MSETIQATVKIHNDFSNEKLAKMNAREIDLLMTICSKIKNHNSDMVQIKFDEIRKLSNYTSTSNTLLKTDLNKTNKNLVKSFVITYLDNDGAEVTKSLFEEFRVYEKQGYLKVSVCPKLSYILNDLSKNFTRFELAELVSLESKYSKRLYKLLKKWRTQGKYEVNKEQLFKELDVPPKYRICDFNVRVLNPALKECSKYIKNLKCETQKSGRGGAIQSYKFTFTKEIPDNQKELAENFNAEKQNEKSKKYNKNRFNDFKQNNYDFEELECKILAN